MTGSWSWPGWQWGAPATLRLEDVESGVVIWRETLQPRNGEAFESPAGMVRAGVAVLAGRAYRLTAHGTGDALPVIAGPGDVQAMMLPGRSAGS